MYRPGSTIPISGEPHFGQCFVFRIKSPPGQTLISLFLQIRLQLDLKYLQRFSPVGDGVFLLRRQLGEGLFQRRHEKHRVIAEAALPLGGAVLSGLYGLETTYGDNDLDLLIRGGVTPAERTGGVTSVVRGVTTRTTTDGTADTTWRELSTILVVDDVIPGIRSALRSKFHRAKNTEQSRGAIRSQVVLELENRKEREIISGYDNVAVSADPDNPTVCQVEFSFSAAQGLNQIWLTAHITV